jgi:hypothetical protein
MTYHTMAASLTVLLVAVLALAIIAETYGLMNEVGGRSPR